MRHLLFGGVALGIATLLDLRSMLSFAATATLLEYTWLALGVLVMRYCPPSLAPDSIDGDDSFAMRVYVRQALQLTRFWTDTRMLALIWSFFAVALLAAYVALAYDLYMYVEQVFYALRLPGRHRRVDAHFWSFACSENIETRERGRGAAPDARHSLIVLVLFPHQGHGALQGLRGAR